MLPELVSVRLPRGSIQDVFDILALIYTIIVVALAVLVLLRLRKEFSRSTGRERPLQLTSKPSDRYGGLATPGSRSPKASMP